MNTRSGFLVAACAAGLVACSSTEPSGPSIVGTWNLVSFSDSGTVGVTTGTMTFAAAGSWTVLGTVTYPGEPLDSLTGGGTWVQNGLVLTLGVSGGTSAIWDMAFSGNQVVLTGRPPVFSVITLARP